MTNDLVPGVDRRSSW